MNIRKGVATTVAAFAVFACVSALLVGSISCGGSPSGPEETATPTPRPGGSTAPTAGPTATPNPCVAAGSCEAPTTNTNPPTEIRMRMYLVRKPDGDAAPCLNEEPVATGHPLNDPNTRYWFAPIPVGYRVKLDATAYDRFGKPTNHDCSEENRGCITWRFGVGEDLIDEYNTGHIFQPTFKIIGAGDFQIQAEMYNDGSRVRSPWYWMSFVVNPAESPCSR
jgi:hypothetical protein